jgi:phosphonatase-like hydrolase
MFWRGITLPVLNSYIHLMPTPSLVVFDMAGTTVKDNDNVHAALINAMRKGGYEVSRADANAVMGYPKPYAIHELLKIKEPDVELINDSLINSLHQHFLSEMLDFYREDASVQPTKGAEEVFEELHAHGIKVALDTGFSRDIADVIVKRFGWWEKGLIDAMAASDEVPGGRPHPYMIQKIMKDLDIADVTAVAKVGDTPSDMMEGENTGCSWIIGVTSGACTSDELKGYRHTHLVSELREILPILLS